MKEKIFSQKRLYKFLVELEMPTGITLYMRPDSFPRYLQELSLPEHYDELKEAAYSESVVRKAKAYETG
ncbi:MAG: hypothetical protein QMD14_02320, partial [Candidatus Aenigmarchaeota archaeon]|nr:hypothetical protein [Candidatus Aenigmarchaeota archaeon]